MSTAKRKHTDAVAIVHDQKTLREEEDDKKKKKQRQQPLDTSLLQALTNALMQEIDQTGRGLSIPPLIRMIYEYARPLMVSCVRRFSVAPPENNPFMKTVVLGAEFRSEETAVLFRFNVPQTPAMGIRGELVETAVSPEPYRVRTFRSNMTSSFRFGLKMACRDPTRAGAFWALDQYSRLVHLSKAAGSDSFRITPIAEDNRMNQSGSDISRVEQMSHQRAFQLSVSPISGRLYITGIADGIFAVPGFGSLEAAGWWVFGGPSRYFTFSNRYTTHDVIYCTDNHQIVRYDTQTKKVDRLTGSMPGPDDSWNLEGLHCLWDDTLLVIDSAYATFRTFDTEKCMMSEPLCPFPGDQGMLGSLSLQLTDDMRHAYVLHHPSEGTQIVSQFLLH